MDRRLLLLAVVMLALYAPVVGYPRVYEDANDIEAFERPWPLSGDVIGDAWRHPTRLLRDVSFAIGGTSPRAAHVGNVVLHLVNGILVFVLARSLLGGVGGAVIAAGLFWLHPVQVESVAYISSRADVVATLFVLLALLSVRHAWLCLLMATCAVLAKETAVMALVIPCISAWLDKKSRVIWVVWGIVTGLVVGYGIRHYGRPIEPDYLGAMLAQISRLLALWVFPVNLTIDHDWALITPPVAVLAILAWVVAGSLAAIYDFPKWSWVLGAVLLWFVPRLLIPTAEGLHEHHIYGVSPVLAMGTGYWLKGTA